MWVPLLGLVALDRPLSRGSDSDCRGPERLGQIPFCLAGMGTCQAVAGLAEAPQMEGPELLQLLPNHGQASPKVGQAPCTAHVLSQTPHSSATVHGCSRSTS